MVELLRDTLLFALVRVIIRDKNARGGPIANYPLYHFFYNLRSRYRYIAHYLNLPPPLSLSLLYRLPLEHLNVLGCDPSYRAAIILIHFSSLHARTDADVIAICGGSSRGSRVIAMSYTMGSPFPVYRVFTRENRVGCAIRHTRN